MHYVRCSTKKYNNVTNKLFTANNKGKCNKWENNSSKVKGNIAFLILHKGDG